LDGDSFLRNLLLYFAQDLGLQSGRYACAFVETRKLRASMFIHKFGAIGKIFGTSEFFGGVRLFHGGGSSNPEILAAFWGKCYQGIGEMPEGIRAAFE
jgi:hypothetical protein